MSSVYLHVPFCESKCPYCDFYSVPPGGSSVPDTYIEALCLDIQRCVPAGTSVDSVFLGGGTPSLLSVSQMERIVMALKITAEFDPGFEFSIEVNPSTASLAWLKEVRGLGVNRLSIGVQSFQDGALQLLGRRHSGAAALECVANARAAGFENINIDMMFALPPGGDNSLRRAWMEADQGTLAQLMPEHVSVYGLTLEPDTPFGIQAEQGLLVESGEEEFRQQYLAWHQALHTLNYRHYEISNYARAGRECCHNLAYWERCTCYACGAGAHAFSETGWGIRSACAADVDSYVAAVQHGEDPRHEVERFTAQGAMAEWVYLRLRTAQGVDEGDFYAIFGVEFSKVYAHAIRACGAALHRSAGRWYLQPQEWLLYNYHVQKFLL